MYAYYGPDEITPWLSYDEEAIRFLYETGTTTDLDLYLMEGEAREEE